MADGILLLHAWPLDGSIYDAQVEALRTALPGTAVLAPHLPGFGGAEPPTTGVLTMDEAADAALAAADAAGADRVVLAGTSMGGYVALAAWRRHRGRVLGLVLANTRAVADDEAGRDRRRALAARLRAEGNGFLVADPPPLLAADAPAALWERVRATIGAQPAESIAAAALGMAERPDSTPDLAGIDVPVLAVAGSADGMIPLAEVRAMADAIPDGRLEVLPTGHLSCLEAPDALSRLLAEHAARCLGR